MAVINQQEQERIDSLWRQEMKYFAQFQNVSLPLGGFNMEDCQDLFLLIKNYCYEKNLSAVRIADVGCFTGLSSLLLWIATEKFGGRVYSVDWFKGSSKTNLEFAGRYFNLKQIYEDNLAQFEGHHIQLIDAKSVEAATQFENNSLDVVFLDADHRYEFIKQDIDTWLPKLKQGGLLAGHDCEVIMEKGLNSLYEIFNDSDIIEVLHLGVCRAVMELGGKKFRSLNPNAPHESLKSGIWYYVKP